MAPAVIEMCQRAHLTKVNGSRRCFSKVAKVTSIRLTTGRDRRTGNAVGGNIAVVCGLKCGLVTGANGSEDGVGSVNSLFLVRFILCSWVCSRVEKDKG